MRKKILWKEKKIFGDHAKIKLPWVAHLAASNKSLRKKRHTRNRLKIILHNSTYSVPHMAFSISFLSATQVCLAKCKKKKAKNMKAILLKSAEKKNERANGITYLGLFFMKKNIKFLLPLGNELYECVFYANSCHVYYYYLFHQTVLLLLLLLLPLPCCVSFIYYCWV